MHFDSSSTKNNYVFYEIYSHVTLPVNGDKSILLYTF